MILSIDKKDLAKVRVARLIQDMEDTQRQIEAAKSLYDKAKYEDKNEMKAAYYAHKAKELDLKFLDIALDIWENYAPIILEL